MNKKYLVLFICIFMISGCEATYNLNIENENYKEETSIVEKDLSTFYSDSASQVAYNNFSKIPVPIMYDIIPPTPSQNIDIRDMKEKNIDYYKVDELTGEEKIGFKYTGDFAPDNIEKSAMIKYATSNVNIENDENKVTIEAKSLKKIFAQFPTLDVINININLNNSTAIENNADKKEKNTYSWKITRNNYKEKNIYLKFKTPINSNNTYFTFLSTGKIIIYMSATIAILSIIIWVIYNYINQKKEETNKF